MTEYRKKAKKAARDNDNDKSLNTKKTASPRIDAYMTLAVQYGLPTDMMIGTSTSGKYQQTVKEEYQAYVMAPRSDRVSDPLMFWEACGDISGAWTY